MYANRTPPEIPPCDSCRVEPFRENEEALQIFLVTRYQLIMGPMQPIDINHLAIYEAMDLYGVKDRRKCFEKVLRVAHWWLEHIKSKSSMK